MQTYIKKPDSVYLQFASGKHRRGARLRNTQRRPHIKENGNSQSWDAKSAVRCHLMGPLFPGVPLSWQWQWRQLRSSIAPISGYICNTLSALNLENNSYICELAQSPTIPMMAPRPLLTIRKSSWRLGHCTSWRVGIGQDIAETSKL